MVQYLRPTFDGVGIRRNIKLCMSLIKEIQSHKKGSMRKDEERKEHTDLLTTDL